ncbi:hypothetical protein [Acidovorax sp.]|uniref:hypothetical protein n=1 Tax=Acidovorax sp. TaxID=1872122 RepID=UPI0025BA9D66|nr:hypothetical protein [Acidovorax sp.]MCI5068423.1 hypothetical protein [Acidovorax sp.]
MLDLEEDMAAVFYGSDFATTFTRQRPLVADVEVLAIFGVLDEEALDGRAIAASRMVRMPSTQDVRADDVLVAVHAIPGQNVAAGARFRVLDNPQRVNDGAEMEALLGSVSA